MDRAAVAIGKADRDHRTGAPIGDEVRQLRKYPRLGRRRREVDIARQPFGLAAIGVADYAGQVDDIAFDSDPTPHADRPAAVCRAFDRIERHF